MNNATKGTYENFSDLWHDARDDAIRAFPPPIPNGFYQVDRNQDQRKTERWRIIITHGVTPAMKDRFFLDFEHEFIDRQYYRDLAAALNIDIARKPEKSVKKLFWETALKNGEQK